MHFKTHLKIYFVAGSVAFAGTYAVAATEAYKCTTEEGKISYLDTKPATGCAKVELVRINVGKGSSEDVTAEGGEEGGATATDAEQEKAIAEKKALVQKECEAKRKNLETLKSKMFIQTKDAEGKVRTLKPEEIQDSIKRTQEFIDNMCSK